MHRGGVAIVVEPLAGVPLYVTSRGLGTTLVPFKSEGFELDFDFTIVST